MASGVKVVLRSTVRAWGCSPAKSSRMLRRVYRELAWLRIKVLACSVRLGKALSVSASDAEPVIAAHEASMRKAVSPLLVRRAGAAFNKLRK